MKKMLLFFFLGSSISSFSQNVEAANGDSNFNPENIHRRINQDRTVNCGIDTLLYVTAKTTATSALSINNASSAHAMAQYFEAPTDITISGVEFIAYKANTTGGTAINVTVEIFNTTADSLPTGTALASTIVSVDTNYYLGNLALLSKSANFSVPVTTSAPYCVVITNNSANAINMYSSSYTALDGGQEWLASAKIGASWVRGYNVNVGGVDFDADMFMHPYVSYDLTADFMISPNCADGGLVTANHTSISVGASKMYSTSTFAGSEGDQYTWDWGDSSPTETGVAPTHTYATGTYNVVLTDTIFGWTGTCRESRTKSTCDQPASLTNEDIVFSLYPNPAANSINLKSSVEISQIEIFDLTGKLILLQETKSTNYSIDINSLANGLYIAKIKLADGMLLNKQFEVKK